jgi:hypothetical protein
VFTPIAETVTEFPISDIILKTGRYYFGYFQDDLIDGNQGIWEQVQCWNKTLFFRGHSIIMSAPGNVLDRENRSYPGQTFGLNLEISSFKDHTRQIRRR